MVLKQMINSLTNYKVSTTTINHQSIGLNWGRVTPIEIYVVNCLDCDNNECKTATVIEDGEKISSMKLKLLSAKCGICLKERYF